MGSSSDENADIGDLLVPPSHPVESRQVLPSTSATTTDIHARMTPFVSKDDVLEVIHVKLWDQS